MDLPCLLDISDKPMRLRLKYLCLLGYVMDNLYFEKLLLSISNLFAKYYCFWFEKFQFTIPSLNQLCDIVKYIITSFKIQSCDIL